MSARNHNKAVTTPIREMPGAALAARSQEPGYELGGGSALIRAAQAIAPDARVVYVDNDPVVCSHGQALLGQRDTVGVALGDLRRPADILRHPEVLAKLDFSQPVGVLCVCALHFVPAGWRPDPGTRPAGRPDSLHGGVGRKPAP